MLAIVLSENCRSNPEWDGVSRSLGRLQRSPCALLRGTENGTAPGDPALQCLTCLNRKLPYQPAVFLLGTHVKERVTVVQTRNCTQTFIEELFTTAKRWKPLKYLSEDEWWNKLSFIHMKECYSAVERGVLIQTTNRGNLENTVLSKRSQSEAISFMTPFIQNVWGRQTYRQRKELSGYLGLSGIVWDIRTEG